MLTQEQQRIVARLRKAILALEGQPEEVRVAGYNAATSALRGVVSDLCDDPVLAVKLRRAGEIAANDYNPNRVARPEMDLLEQSIRADGVTMPVVAYRDAGAQKSVVIDGFHRHAVLAGRLGRRYIPCTEIDRPIGDRMASTVRHNRARGKHQVDLQAAMIRLMAAEGMADAEIAAKLGMSEEEFLRLKQIVGCARLLAQVEYNSTYGRDDEPPDLLDDGPSAGGVPEGPDGGLGPPPERPAGGRAKRGRE